MPEHRFVKSVVITNDALYLDGEQFPLYIADGGLTIEEPAEQPEYFKILNLRLLVPVGEGWGDDLATIEDRRSPELLAALAGEPADVEEPDIPVKPGATYVNAGEGWNEVGYLAAGTLAATYPKADRLAELESVIRQIGRTVRRIPSVAPTSRETYDAIMETRRLVDSANVPYVGEEK